MYSIDFKIWAVTAIYFRKLPYIMITMQAAKIKEK